MRPLLSLRAIVFGLLLMLYFGLCYVIGIADRIELRFLNILILGAGLWGTLYSKALRGKNFGVKYFKGLKAGLLFSFIASVVFSFSFFLFTWLGDFGLIESFVQQGLINESVTALHLTALVFVETFVSGFILAFIMMQYLKYNWREKEELEYS